MLSNGISITFSNKTNTDCFLINSVCRKKNRFPRFRILIGTAPIHFKFEKEYDSGVRGKNLLEEQKITLMHELIHIFHCHLTGEPLGCLYDVLGFGTMSCEYEKTVDRKALEIVRRDGLFEAIVAELSFHPDCKWKYEVATPFFDFHRDLISYRLLSQVGRLQFSNPQQIQLLRLCRQMYI